VSVPAKLLVVDDEAQIRRLLRVTLERAGYVVAQADSARAALSLLPIEKPELVLLDLGLPDRDGLELLSLIRQSSDAKILIVSAREETGEKVAALDLGADDYVTKPFDADELLARVRAALRQRLAAQASQAQVSVGEIVIDLLARVITRRGGEVHLTPKEYGLLAELAKHPGRVVTHDQLLRAVWGPAYIGHAEYLRVTMRGLRAKLEPNPAVPVLLINEPGVGYRLVGAR
jgi:two-component system KDP operon response regulator KdpE